MQAVAHRTILAGAVELDLVKGGQDHATVRHWSGGTDEAGQPRQCDG